METTRTVPQVVKWTEAFLATDLGREVREELGTEPVVIRRERTNGDEREVMVSRGLLFIGSWLLNGFWWKKAWFEPVSGGET
jgi:hypothetical protein